MQRHGASGFDIMIGSLRPWLPLSLVAIVRNWHPPSPLCEERHGGSTSGQKLPSADDRSFPRENSNWLPLWQIGIFSLLSRSFDIHRCVPCSTISLLHYCIELSVGCSVVFQALKKRRKYSGELKGAGRKTDRHRKRSPLFWIPNVESSSGSRFPRTSFYYMLERSRRCRTKVVILTTKPEFMSDYSHSPRSEIKLFSISPSFFFWP